MALDRLERLERFEQLEPIQSVRQRYGHEYMRFVADHAGDVSFTRGVVGQHDIARFKCPYDTGTRLDFPGAGKRHQELAPGRRMKVEHGSWWNTPEDRAGCGPGVGGKYLLIAAEFEFDLFKV